MQIIQFFRRRSSAVTGAFRPHVQKRPYAPLRKPNGELDELDELFAKLAAVPRLPKTPVVLRANSAIE